MKAILKSCLRRFFSLGLVAVMLFGFVPEVRLNHDGTVSVDLDSAPLAITAEAAAGDALQSVATVTTGGDVASYVDIVSTYTPSGYNVRQTGTKGYSGSPGTDSSYHTDQNGSTSNSWKVVATNDLSWSKNSGNTGVTGTLSSTAKSDYKGCGENGALSAKVNSKVIQIHALADIRVSFNFSSQMTMSVRNGEGNIQEGVYTLLTSSASPTVAQLQAGTVRSHVVNDGATQASATGTITEAIPQGEYLYVYFYGFAYDYNSGSVSSTNYTYTAGVTGFQITPITEKYTLTVGNTDCADNPVGGGKITVNGTAVTIPASGSTAGLSNVFGGTSVSLAVSTVPTGYQHIGWRVGNTDIFEKNYSFTLEGNTTVCALLIPEVTVTMGSSGYSDATYSYKTPAGTKVTSADQYIARNSSGSAYYKTLAEAFSANNTVVLLGNVVLNGDFTIPAGKTLSIQRGWDDPATTALQHASGSTATSIFAKATINGNVTLQGNLVASGIQGDDNSLNGRAVGGVGQFIVNGTIDVVSGGKIYAYGMITGPGQINVASGASVYELMEIRDMRSVYVLPDVASGGAFPVNSYFIKTNEVTTTYSSGATLHGLYYVKASGLFGEGDITVIGTTNSSMFKLSSGSMTKSFSAASPYNNKMIFRAENGSVIDTGKFSVTIEGQNMDTSNYELPLNYAFAIEIMNGAQLNMNYDYKLLPGALVDVKEGGTLNVVGGKKLVLYRANDYKYTARTGFPAVAYPTAFTKPTGLSYASNTAANIGSAKLIVDGTLNVAGGLYVTEQLSGETTYDNGYNYLTGIGTINITGTQSNGTIKEWTEGGSGADSYADSVTVAYVPIKGLTNFDATADDGQTDYSSFSSGAMYGYINNSGVNVWSSTAPVVLTFNANGGEGEMASVHKLPGSTFTVAENGFMPPIGFGFNGWNTAADGTGDAYQPGDSLSPSASITLYAQWIEVPPMAKVVWADGTTPDTDYWYVQHAVEAAVNAGDRVVLLQDLPSFTYTVPGSENGYVLDLNGKTITSANPIVNVAEDLTLTIELNGGTLDYHTGATAAASAYRGVAAVLNTGTLTIQDTAGGGKITTDACNDNSSLTNYVSAVRNNAGGTLTVTGGEIVTSQNVNNYSVGILNYGTLDFTPSTDLTFNLTRGYGVYNAGTGTANIDLNGKIIDYKTGATAAATAYRTMAGIGNGGTMTIQDSVGGGYITSDIASNNGTTNTGSTIKNQTTGNLTITNATVKLTQALNANNAALFNRGTVSISGSAIRAEGTKTGGYAIFNYVEGKITLIDDSTIYSYVSNGIYNYNGASITTIRNSAVHSYSTFGINNYGATIDTIDNVRTRTDSASFARATTSYYGLLNRNILAGSHTEASPFTLSKAGVIDTITGCDFTVASVNAIRNDGTINTITNSTLSGTAAATSNASVLYNSRCYYQDAYYLYYTDDSATLTRHYVDDTEHCATIGTISDCTITARQGRRAISNEGHIGTITGSASKGTSITTTKGAYTLSVTAGGKIDEITGKVSITSSNSSYGYAVYVSGAKTATRTITYSDKLGGTASVSSYTYAPGSESEITTIDGTVTITTTNSYAIYIAGGKIGEIKDGAVVKAKTTPCVSVNNLTLSNSDPADTRTGMIDTISGGTFSITAAGTSDAVKDIITNAGTINTISGGTFNSTVAYVIPLHNNATTALVGEISGGSFTAGATSNAIKNEKGTIGEISGGTITAPYSAVINSSGGTINAISGGTIKSTGYSAVYNSGTIGEISGGEFESKNTTASYAQYATLSNRSGGTVGSVSGGVFTNTNASGIAVNNDSANAINVTGGHFKGGTGGRATAIADADNTAKFTYPTGKKLSSGTESATVNGSSVDGYYYIASVFTITFNANEGTGTMDPLTVESGQSVTLTANTFIRENYEFAGWNTVAAPTTETPGVAYIDEAEITVTDNMTLYAQWTSLATGYHVSVEDYVTDGDGGYDFETSLEEGTYTEVTFTVYCEKACIVLWAPDSDEEDLTRVIGEEVDDDTYEFTISGFTEDITVYIILKGDADLNGEVDLDDVDILDQSLYSIRDPYHVDLTELQFFVLDFDQNEDVDLDDVDILDQSLYSIRDPYHADIPWDI